jgi:hemoglobin-like flavoprotein
MITARQRALVEGSWRLIRPLGPQVAELFYDRLFELDPSLEELFPGDPVVQGKKLMDAIGVVARGLGELDAIVPVLHDLGRRHEAYGVRVGHYTTMGKALLWTFEQTLAEDFTPQVNEAWAALYALVSSAMIGAADGREAHSGPKASQLSV